MCSTSTGGPLNKLLRLQSLKHSCHWSEVIIFLLVRWWGWTETPGLSHSHPPQPPAALSSTFSSSFSTFSIDRSQKLLPPPTSISFSFVSSSSTACLSHIVSWLVTRSDQWSVIIGIDLSPTINILLYLDFLLHQIVPGDDMCIYMICNIFRGSRYDTGQTKYRGDFVMRRIASPKILFYSQHLSLEFRVLFSQGWSQWEKETNLAGSALPGWLNEQTCGQALLQKEKCRRLLPGFQQRRLGNDMPTFVFLKLSRKVSPHWYDRKYFFF